MRYRVKGLGLRVEVSNRPHLLGDWIDGLEDHVAPAVYVVRAPLASHFRSVPSYRNLELCLSLNHCSAAWKARG